MIFLRQHSESFSNVWFQTTSKLCLYWHPTRDCKCWHYLVVAARFRAVYPFLRMRLSQVENLRYGYVTQTRNAYAHTYTRAYVRIRHKLAACRNAAVRVPSLLDVDISRTNYKPGELHTLLDGAFTPSRWQKHSQAAKRSRAECLPVFSGRETAEQSPSTA